MGSERLQERIAATWAHFFPASASVGGPWLHVVVGHGRQAVEATYAALLDGTLAANEGRILSV